MTADPTADPAPWRAVSRDGRDRLLRINLPSDPLHDVYHLLLSTTWAQLLGLYAVAFLTVNGVFALLYWAGGQDVEHATGFADEFFFSVQTMCTIGYGVMAPHGLYANVLATLEAFTGVVIFSIATGIAFAKFSRPTARVLFSRVAVVRPWDDGVPALQFRMGNLRGNRIIEARITLTLMRNETRDGENLRRFHDLQLTRSTATFFALSWTATHLIDKSSPLYGRSADDLRRDQCELIVSLLGLDENFAQTVHARYSYVADEIVWNARFVDVLTSDAAGHRGVDYAHFHAVQPIEGRPHVRTDPL
jgi:inward rectifier potassium channel